MIIFEEVILDHTRTTVETTMVETEGRTISTERKFPTVS